MNIKPKQLIIIGGGASIKACYLSLLKGSLAGKLTIGTNYSYKFIDTTLQACVDSTFYNAQYKELSELRFVVSGAPSMTSIAKNTLSLKPYSSFDQTLKKGVYKANLTGIYSLSLACYLMNEKDSQIFLLGYDYGVKQCPAKGEIATTHFYQGQLEHRGIGKINYYMTKDRADKDFDVFKQATAKIYNVSLESNINTFEKITYENFFEMLDYEAYHQEDLIEYVKARFSSI